MKNFNTKINNFYVPNILKMVEEELDEVVGGKINIKTSVSRIIAIALSTLSMSANELSLKASPNVNKLNTVSTEDKYLHELLPEIIVEKHNKEYWTEDIKGIWTNHVGNLYKKFYSHDDESYMNNIKEALKNIFGSYLLISDAHLTDVANRLKDSSNIVLTRESLLRVLLEECFNNIPVIPFSKSKLSIEWFSNYPGEVVAKCLPTLPNYLFSSQVFKEKLEQIDFSIHNDSMLAYLKFISPYVNLAEKVIAKAIVSVIGNTFFIPEGEKLLANSSSYVKLKKLCTDWLKAKDYIAFFNCFGDFIKCADQDFGIDIKPIIQEIVN